MKNNSTEKFVTVNQLRVWLDEHEADWGVEDVKYLGEFGDQLILMWLPQQGYAPCIAYPEWGFGGPMFCAINQNGEEIK